MTRIVLVRHGESRANIDRVIRGFRTCNGLSEVGAAQVARLRDRWLAHRPFTPDLLVSSEFARARETAEVLVPALDGLPVVEDPGFGEHDPGPDCDGLSYEEYRERYGTGDEAWNNGNPFDTTFPGGETIAAFHFRVGTALQQLIAEHAGRTVVIACHGGVVGIVLRIALKAPPIGLFQTYTSHASITDVELGAANQWRLHRYNDTAHLEGLG